MGTREMMSRDRGSHINSPKKGEGAAEVSQHYEKWSPSYPEQLHFHLYCERKRRRRRRLSSRDETGLSERERGFNMPHRPLHPCFINSTVEKIPHAKSVDDKNFKMMTVGRNWWKQYTLKPPWKTSCLKHHAVWTCWHWYPSKPLLNSQSLNFFFFFLPPL